MEKQVEKEHYNFFKYLDKKRWNSYYYQIKESLKSNPLSVLVIGIGDGLVVKILKEYVKEVFTFDIAEDLNPDYIGSVTEIDKIVNREFDCVICCQVLEHLPFSEFEKALIAISRVTRKKCILSLPQQYFWNEIKIELFEKIKVRMSIYIPKFLIKWQFDGEHYWEIGTRGYSIWRIEKLLKKFFSLEKSFTSKSNRYHRFFYLIKK